MKEMSPLGRLLNWAIVVGLLCAGASGAWAQQIYRWTDEHGNVNFGNAPPPNAKDLETKDRIKTKAESDCEAAAQRQCQREVGDIESVYRDFPSTAIRNCLAAYTRNCANLSKPQNRSTPAPRVIVTGRLPFEARSGDGLVCQMSCDTECSGTVEIFDTESLGKGENSGMKEYAVKVAPERPGSAYCRVTTRDSNIRVALNLVRANSVVSSVRGSDGN